MSARGKKAGKSTQPPSNSRARSRAKKMASDNEDPPVTDKATQRVKWNDQRTDRLVQWLENNPEDRQRLFSDSAQDAKEQNRRCRTAKNPKTSFHIKMAEYIFSVDEDPKTRDDLRGVNGTKKYSKAVENCIGM